MYLKMFQNLLKTKKWVKNKMALFAKNNPKYKRFLNSLFEVKIKRTAPYVVTIKGNNNDIILSKITCNKYIKRLNLRCFIILLNDNYQVKALIILLKYYNNFP